MSHALKVASLVWLLVAIPALAGAQAPKDGFFTAWDGVKIHYLTAGESGSWVVLVHGYTDTAQRM